MAVEVYSTTSAMVLARLPVDSTSIGVATTPLSTADLDAFIEDGAAQITGILGSLGLGVPTGEDMLAQVQASIVNYAVWKALEALPSVPRDRINAAEKSWLDDLTRYSNRGEFLVTQAADKNETNVSTLATKRASDFRGLNYEF
jgi:hypothetical protein